MNPDISVVILNWNTKDFLLNCVQSIIDMTHEAILEIIVVDNASSDGSAQAVKKHFPQCKIIINQENFGFSKGNNIGIKSSTGRYICIVNSDIEIRPHCFDILLSYMDQHLEVGVCGPKILNGDLSLRKNCQNLPTLWNTFCTATGLYRLNPIFPFFRSNLMATFDHNQTIRCEVLPGCFLMVRRKALEAVGYLDEQFFIYAEDYDWCRRFNENNWPIVFVHNAAAIHFAKQSSRKTPVLFSKEKLKANMQYWQKHHSQTEVAIFRVIKLLHLFLRYSAKRIQLITHKSHRDKLRTEVNSYDTGIRYLMNYKFKPPKIQ